MRHFARRSAQALQDLHVVQERDYGRDDDLVLRDERLKRAERVDVWGMEWECDFLIRLPELIGYKLGHGHTMTHRRDSPPSQLHLHPLCPLCLLVGPSAQDASAVPLTA
jgi:hypothetical protein